jgi:GTP-binding protein
VAFIDEAKILVFAGNGGAGCLSFLREKFIPKGGPDGGDGGDGGSVYLVATTSRNTLGEFRYKKRFRAQNGESGKGRQRRGKSGDDLLIPVPVGTIVTDLMTGEVIGDLIEEGQTLLVAQGGFHGLGNLRYKSSTNRAPRQTSPGTPGEDRELHLELKLLADAGLLGLPNAGKSTLIAAISNAHPRIADYPFTTLEPQLGVVDISPTSQFVIADIPGLIEGASEGLGLGHRFLKHLSRTGLLLHLVGVDPYEGIDASVAGVKVIEQELARYSSELSEKERWLVLNKIDLLPEQDRHGYLESLRAALRWQGPLFAISAAERIGTRELSQAIMRAIEISANH